MGKQLVFKIREKNSGKFFTKTFFRNGSLAVKAGDIYTRKKPAENRKDELESLKWSKDGTYEWEIVTFQLKELSIKQL